MQFYLVIPEAPLRDEELLNKPKSILLMGEIYTNPMTFTDGDTTSDEEFAMRLHCTPRAIQKYLKLLENRGYIKRYKTYDDAGRIVGRRIVLN